MKSYLIKVIEIDEQRYQQEYQYRIQMQYTDGSDSDVERKISSLSSKEIMNIDVDEHSIYTILQAIMKEMAIKKAASIPPGTVY